MKEFSKGVLKFAFYLCAYFVENFYYTSVIEIEKKIKEIIEIVTSIKQIEVFFEEAKNFRVKGQYKTEFEILRGNFIGYVILLLKNGILHRNLAKDDLNTFLTKYFGRFPYLKRYLKEHSEVKKQKTKYASKDKIFNLDLGMQSVNFTGIVKEKSKLYRFTKANGSKGNVG